MLFIPSLVEVGKGECDGKKDLTKIFIKIPVHVTEFGY